MIKLIASDLDGTLLQHGAQSLDSKLFPLIRQLKDNGIHFVAASGRQHYNMRNLFTEVKDEISYISENGGLYTLNGKIHTSSLLSPVVVKEIIETVRRDPDCELTISCADSLYIEPKNSRFSTHIKDVVGYHVTVVDDLLSVVDKPVLKMAICNKRGIAYSSSKYEELFSHQIGVITSGNLWLDFMPLDVSKGTALTHMLEILDISPSECMAFGDQWNDETMLRMVGVSYAMKNAVPGISDFCTHTTDSVIKVLETLL